jgi:hypothetical protein
MTKNLTKSVLLALALFGGAALVAEPASQALTGTAIPAGTRAPRTTPTADIPTAVRTGSTPMAVHAMATVAGGIITGRRITARVLASASPSARR